MYNYHGNGLSYHSKLIIAIYVRPSLGPKKLAVLGLMLFII